MLKIWKRTWKGPDDPRPMRDNDEADILGGPSSSASSALPLENSGIKRSRTSGQLEDLINDQPHKKPRRHQQPASGSLGNHLPEINDADEVESLLPRSISAFREQVLEQAKHENIIVALPPLRTAFSIVVQFLVWAIENERSRRNLVSTRHRTALLLVDDELSVDKYSAKIEVEMPHFLIGKYSASHQHGDPWPILLQQDVVVVPSTFLLHSLFKGTLAITQFHVLIISNAQDIQDQDSNAFLPLVQVMNDFYRITDPLSRPRVFALATLPADRGFPFDSAMLRLEQTLDSKVVGVSAERREEILSLPDRPNEVVVLYDAPIQPATTKLFKRLQQCDPSESVFRKHFRASRHVLAGVGACASDLIWRRALKEIESSVSPWYEDDEDEDGRSLSTASKQQQIWVVVKNWPFTMPNLDPSSRGFNVTHKFLKLVKVLKSCEPYGEGFRGIVFVQRSAVAFVIVELLRMLDEQVGFLRPYALVGHDFNSSPNHLQEVFRTFATGGYNLLIATNSVEDLEVPKAYIVVQFDVIDSPVSQAYVRACTRGRESHLVHLAERGNEIHRRILFQITHLDAKMLRWTESICNTLQSSVPPYKLRECVASYHSDDDDDDDLTREFLRDPTTSSRIYLEDATTVVYRFSSKLSCDGEGVNAEQTLFEFEDERKAFDMPHKYVCTVLLPETPVHRTSGPPSISRAIARRAACYKVCESLAKTGLLDYRLFPLSSNLTAKNEPALDLSNDKGGARSYIRKHPDFWINTGSKSTELLYPIIISDYADEAMQPHSPFLILTRQPLPVLASFKLFFAGVSATVNFKRGAPFHPIDIHLTNLYLYTVRLVRIITNKPYACPMANMMYFFAPLTVKWSSLKDNTIVLPSVVEHIPWDLVALAGNKFAVPLKNGTLGDMEQDIKGAVIQDRWVEFTRRYDAVRMRPDLTPLSKPLDSPREAEYDSLLDFCKARRKNFQGLLDYGQPIIQVSKVPNMLNLLNPISRELTSSMKAPAKYLIPELCAKFTIPAITYRSALLLPSITRRIDDFLLVKELNAKLFRHSISEDLLHIAICAPSAGYEYNYERLELLGDAFLKYLSTLYVFVTYPSHNEGTLHTARQRIISNKSLFQHASHIGLPAYIQAKPFTSKDWHPPNFFLDQLSRVPDNKPTQNSTPRDNIEDSQAMGVTESPIDPPTERSSLQCEPTTAPVVTEKPNKKNKKRLEDTHWLGDKAVADVAEAIIGAAYITGGREIALKVTKALRIPVLGIEQWSDFGRKVLSPPPKYMAKLRPESVAAIESIIGHKIARPHLLAQALTHSSIQGYESTSYERLEFIGDAILDFMVIRYIFDRDHQLSPGGLTLLKGAMVSNSVLAAACVWSGLHKHLLYESYVLANSIREYITKLEAKQAGEYEAAEREGRAPGQYWLDIDPPKALSDVIESIVGAIYISDNFMPVGAEALFDNVLKQFYDRHITLKTLSHHPTKVLFEVFQAQGCRQFAIQKEKSENATRCHVLVHDVILASGEDTVLAVAARRASLFALDALEGDAAFLTRTCDCRTVSQTKKKQKQKTLENVLLDFEEEERDILAVEKVLTGDENMSSRRASEEVELEEVIMPEWMLRTRARHSK